ncbi:MAG: GAF domain-containing sensor histidine kinase [Chloroflexota bacterium]|nr:GAF domain-containing sensor histidine kinase [Chloroflexota bacterium]
MHRLKCLAVLAPLVFLAGLELVRRTMATRLFAEWPGYLLLGGIVLLGTLFFAEAIFGVIGQMQDRLTQQNRELLALHEAGVAIVGELALDAVLQRVVDQARDLVGARYGALSYLRDEGGIAAFLTSGITDEERARIGPIPEGHGLLGVVLTEGQRLRLPDLGRDPRSVGFPPHHPPMRSLLAVPILSQGKVLGNLYLTEKNAAPEFDMDDEETLERFATQAALAIENARLHRQVHALAVTEERERIAREMHDSLAQVLGYVNTKAQAAQALLGNDQSERAAVQIGQLAEAAREAYADVREGILGLRTSPGQERGFVETLRLYLERWEDQSGVTVDLDLGDPVAASVRLAPLAEVQLLRVVQEALANVRKHAQAHQARVRLRQSEEWIEVTIEDDGVGFDTDGAARAGFPRFGQAIMRERAEAVGGLLDVTSRPGQGTRVSIRVPAEREQVVQRRRADAHPDR